MKSYGIAFLVSLLTIAIKYLLDRHLGWSSPFILLLTAILISAWEGGFGPGLLATILTTIAGVALFLPRAGSMDLSHREVARLIAFIFEGVFLNLLLENRHRAIRAEQQARSALEHEMRERRAVEEAIKTELVFRQSLENALLAGITVINKRGEQTYVNPAFCEMVGWSAEELLGGTYPYLYWPPEEMERIEQAFRQVQAGHLPKDGFELRLCCKSGERFEALIHSAPVRDFAGETVGWVASVTDISRRVQAEKALVERIREIEAIMHAAPVAICIAQDRECNRITGNEWADRLMHVPREVNNLTKTGPQEENLTHFTLWAEGRLLADKELPMQYAAATGENVRDWEGELRFDDGSVTTCLGNATPLYDASGEVRGAVGAFIDITEPKRRQREIERLNVQLHRSIRETHHRVKNNLQIIAALLDMQAIQHTDQVPISQITRLRQHISALAAIHDLLTHQAKEDTEVDAISARAALQKLLPMLQAMFQRGDIDLSAEDIPLSIQQGTTLTVLVNEMVSNAIKHGAGPVQVRLALEEGQVALEVSDSGPGFPPEFTPAKAANTGLDLIESLTRYDLSGQVAYENRGEGGARVRLTFPPVRPVRLASRV